MVAVRSNAIRKSAAKAFDVKAAVLTSTTEAVSRIHALYYRAIIKFRYIVLFYRKSTFRTP